MGSLQFQLQVHLGRPKSLLENSIKEGWLVTYKNLTVNPLNINVLLKQTLSKPFISIKANTQPFIWYLISSYHFLNDLYPFSVIFEGSTSFLTTWNLNIDRLIVWLRKLQNTIVNIEFLNLRIDVGRASPWFERCV